MKQDFHWKHTALALAVLSASHTALANDSNALEEVVVTAQFVEQNLQETPVAITAVTGEMLEARGQLNVQDIAAQAPNVTLTKGGAYSGPSLIGFIRGVGQTDFNPALEPGVGLYVDDVYYSTLTGSVLDLLDLDRVEVLRGPQGTLAGKNSIGGSIKLYSKKPNEDNDGYVEVGFGDLDALSVRGASNFTIIPNQLFARIAGVSRSRDGHVDNISYECTHPGSGFSSDNVGAHCKTGEEGGIDYTAVRAALRFVPNDSLEVNYSVDLLDEDSQPPANVLLNAVPTTAPVISNGRVWEWNEPFPGGSEVIFGSQGLAVNSGCEFVPYGEFSCDPNKSMNNPYMNYATYTDNRTGASLPRELTMESMGQSLNIDWQINEDLQLQSISAYRTYDSGFSMDGDASPMPVIMMYQALSHTQKSQEIRLNGKVDDFVDWTVGGFWFNGKTDMEARVNLGYVGFDFIHGPDPVDSTTQAVFANAIFYINDKLDLSVGARYSEDDKDYTFQRHNADNSDIQACVGPLGDPANPPNCLISSLNGVSSNFNGDRTDYRLALSYKVTDDIMAYGQLSTGYKGGGVNPRPFYNVQAVSFEPEELDATEIGVKAQFLDNTLRVNAAMFWNDYTNIQFTLSNCTALFGEVYGRPCLANTNAGNADVSGYEFEIDYNPTDNLLIDASYSYLDFQLTEVNAATGLDTSKVMPYSPEKSWSAGAQYTFEMASGTLTPRIDVSYRSEKFTAPINTSNGAIDAYSLVNARLTWTSKEGDWVAAIEGRNLTDKLYYTTKTDAEPGLAGTYYAAPGLPRTITYSIKRNF